MCEDLHNYNPNTVCSLAQDQKLKKLEQTVAHLQQKLESRDSAQIQATNRPYHTNTQADVQNQRTICCNICNRFGHLAAACRSPCRICGRAGHKTVACRMQQQRPGFSRP
uniref:CCHC-type domain-containing protein n=1 Tax=Romanomermis culicivorax TaxID=13658 RepID=A0A915JUU0_ROMCU